MYYLLNTVRLFRTEATRGRHCHCNFRKPSAPMTTAQRVEALVGPSSGSWERVLMKVAAEMPAPESSTMSPSLQVIVSEMLVHNEVVMFCRRTKSLDQNCWANCQPLKTSEEMIRDKSTWTSRGLVPSREMRNPSRIRPVDLNWAKISAVKSPWTAGTEEWKSSAPCTTHSGGNSMGLRGDVVPATNLLRVS